LYKQGVYPTDLVRNPILPFDVVHRQIADQLIKKIIQIEFEIKNKRK
jgi:4-hydroxy-tetrahydrodipicolinate synthase